MCSTYFRGRRGRRRRPLFFTPRKEFAMKKILLNWFLPLIYITVLSFGFLAIIRLVVQKCAAAH